MPLRGRLSGRPAFDQLVGAFETRDGEALHRSVPPSSWCVSCSDVRQFRALVRHAVSAGVLTPQPDDHFDPSDLRVGPSITTVTRQLIAPITQLKGSPSWALMLHPRGLECDVFVTHCWAEGVFEFTDKVIHSWPRRARHAYCCMLSNPQNWDIGGLLSAPVRSPFALALSRARYTLVVPNSTCSIYTRIWCVYEAYMSYDSGKTIMTAKKREIQPCLAAAMLMALSMAFGGLAYGAFQSSMARQAWSLELMRVLAFLCAACALVVRRARAIFYVHVGGGVLCGIVLGQFCADPGQHIKPGSSALAFASCCVWLANGVVWFALCEADRRFEAFAQTEGAQLRQGYTGRVRDAMSSVPEDRERILGEIHSRGKDREVEHAIWVLIWAGTSTSGLREAASLGVDISEAGMWRASLLHAALTGMILKPAVELGVGCACDVFWLTALQLVWGCLWAVLVVSLGPERRSFAASAAGVFVVIPAALFWIVESLVAPEYMYVRDSNTCWDDGVTSLVGAPLALAFSALGVGRVANVPCCGPALAQLIFQGVAWRDLKKGGEPCTSDSDVESAAASQPTSSDADVD